MSYRKKKQKVLILGVTYNRWHKSKSDAVNGIHSYAVAAILVTQPSEESYDIRHIF